MFALLILTLMVPFYSVNHELPYVEKPQLSVQSDNDFTVGARTVMLAVGHLPSMVVAPVSVFPPPDLLFVFFIFAALLSAYIPVQLKRLFLMPIKFTSHFVA
ncbi:hypothetical protein IDH44_14880 [Paenibacillus sp. IB182496]|uniref:Uncharacterized protein n=1 Tax=Paenibacillus sabuli TaxID=2772509 RepID=A0A927BVX5_9BACL|nr:hypothetical protein [Paenibacillus sabuli]MBD2846484.1 hypothetical protein [Paenibacillus sabuli]